MKIGALSYPKAKKTNKVDLYHGIKVIDPYQWLEDSSSKETENWIHQENNITEYFFNQIPFRQEIKDKLEGLWDYEKYGAPFRIGEFTYFYRNSGLQRHYVIYRQKDDEEPEIFLDPNEFSSDGTTSLTNITFTKDGSLAAYQIAERGSDLQKIIVMRTTDQKKIGPPLINVKFSEIAWRGNDGFYYSSYINNNLSSEFTEYHKLYYHKIETPQNNDLLIFGGNENPRRYIIANITEDENFLIIIAANSLSGNQLYILDLARSDNQIINIVSNYESKNFVIENKGTKLYILTNLNAPNFKIITVDLTNPSPAMWKDFVAESPNVMSATTAGGKIFIKYLKHGTSLVHQLNLDGELERQINLPSLGTVSGFKSKREDKETYYTFTSYISPPEIYSYNIATGISKRFKKSTTQFDCKQYVSKRLFYTSKDGTRIPMIITSKKGIILDGKNPLLLYGYGGFGTNVTPEFSISNIILMEQGGIYAVPNLRGGGEYGEMWHLAGTKLNKQNVIDDFIAAAEFLIKNKFTSKSHLAISGNSNGGLLVGATISQRPDLCKVAFPTVGVMDMLRYSKFIAGAGWSSEYGLAEESVEMFKYLLNYSPYHSLKPADYPATLITTGDHDDRVVPAHSYKFTARLQEYQQSSSPIIISIQINSGHGAGRSTDQIINQEVDKWSFFFYNIGLTFTPF